MMRPCDDLARIMQRLLLIIARPARLLECLEFDPEKFYNLLCVAEGQVKQSVPDVPQYIVDKLGLKQDPIAKIADIPIETSGASRSSSSTNLRESAVADTSGDTLPIDAKQQPLASPRGIIPIKTPSPQDFDTIKLVSNGAYGYVRRFVVSVFISLRSTTYFMYYDSSLLVRRAKNYRDVP